MAKKRVLILGNYPPPPGGVPRHIEYLVPALVAGGYETHVLSSGKTGVETHPGFTVYKASQRVRIRAFLMDWEKNIDAWRRHFQDGGWTFRQIYSLLSFISLGRQIIQRNQISIIKAYNLAGFVPMGAILSEEFALPLVISNFGEYYSNPKFFQQHHAFVQFMARQATRRLCMTHHCGAIYKKCGIELPYEIVHYGVDLESFSPGKGGDTLRQKMGIAPEDQVILYLARMTEEMGLGIFISAVKALLSQNGSLKVIIGGKPEELHLDAQQLATEFPDNVFVRPNIPLADLPAYYQAATVVAIPTLGDRACGSLSAAEASATGKPVVASQVGGVPEYAVDGQTGILIPPGDPAALAAALLDICNDASMAERMGWAGRAYMEANFDKAQTNNRMLEILNEILGLRQQ